MDAIANIMNLFIFVFCILFVNIDKTVVCTSVKSIKSLSLSLSLSSTASAVQWQCLVTHCHVTHSVMRLYSKQ